nr:hypothetical protein BaRGS_021353 [Batillaria attramentaria]
MPALQDLALLYKDMGDYDQALALLEKILQGRQFSMGPLDKVTAYKHAGLLLKEMSEREEDGDKKRELDKRGESMLNMALLTASRLCSKLHVPHLHRQVPDIWQSFSTLLKAADQSDRKPHEKVREKARLFQLIKDHKQSIRLLQAMEELAPEEAGNPDHLKMFIDSYVGLQQYEEALAVIEILQSTSESSAIIKLFDDKHYVQKVYMQAAKQALLEPSIQSQLSRVYFHSAFTDIYCGPDSGSTTEDSSTTEEEQGDKEKEEWDVMLLHEGSAEDKATMLASVLQDVFGLKVTRMDQHVLLGRLRLEGVTRTIRRSRLVVVLANERHISGELRYYVTCAAKKKNTVTLLTSDGHVPKMLKKSHRHMVCPGQLLTGLPTQPHPRDQGDDQYSEATVAAMCDLFSFLVDVPDWAASLT